MLLTSKERKQVEREMSEKYGADITIKPYVQHFNAIRNSFDEIIAPEMVRVFYGNGYHMDYFVISAPKVIQKKVQRLVK